MTKNWNWGNTSSLITEVAIFWLHVCAVFACKNNSQCPRGQVCVLDGSYCQTEKSLTKSPSTVVILAPVGSGIAVCAGILIFLICYRRHLKRKRSEREVNEVAHENITSIQGRYQRTGTCNRNLSNLNAHAASSNPNQNQLNLGFEFLNPPPYFSIFTFITQEGIGDIQRTGAETRETPEMQVVWNHSREEDNPPAYDTLSLGPPWPPAYSEIGSDNEHRGPDYIF